MAHYDYWPIKIDSDGKAFATNMAGDKSRSLVAGCSYWISAGTCEERSDSIWKAMQKSLPRWVATYCSRRNTK